MKIKNPFSYLTKFEWGLWLISSCVILLSHILSPRGDLMSLLASLIGVTALIFVAKGHVIGQILIIVFALLYGILSLRFHYYGELITYVGMSAPMASLAAIAWIRHPYQNSQEVAIRRLSGHHVLLLSGATLIVTVGFYFILDALHTANLLIGTLSVTTSFMAASLTYLRSPYYALAYAANDIVLIVLWILAALHDPSYLSMLLCFIMFLINDLYGFFNWKRMQHRQTNAA